MNAARIAIVGTLLTAVLAGAGIYYLQVFAYYDEVTAEEAGEVQLTSVSTGLPEVILYENFKGIDSYSSPIRFRACFETTLSQAYLTELYALAPDAEPLNGPGWFDCYDAREIGEAMEQGDALAFMGVENVTYGVDRIVAILPDGRGFAWHQLNACGDAVFSGDPVPEGCPERPVVEQ